MRGGTGRQGAVLVNLSLEHVPQAISVHHAGVSANVPGSAASMEGVTEVLAGGRIPKHRIVNEEDRMGGIPMSLV